METQEFAREVGRVLSEQGDNILGDACNFSAPLVATELVVPERAYVARLETSGGDKAWFVIEIEPAIAAAGVIAERPKAEIETRLHSTTLEADDVDALGEIVTQLAAAFSTAMAGKQFSFAAGANDGSERPERDAVIVKMSMSPGGVGEGSLLVVVPRNVLESEVPEPAIDASAGFDLSPEEIAALREATRDAAKGSVGRTLVIVPVEREQARWKDLLDKAGVAHDIAGDVVGSLGSLRAGDYDAVIVDADSSPAGGLPTLARIRAAARGVAAVVVASQPTRTHLIGCLAAGVRRYVTKPVDVPALLEQLGTR